MFPLLLRPDDLVGLRATARHKEWKRHYRKRIDRLAIRVHNLVDDLHRRVAYDLVQAFDVILLPSFETKEMSGKSDRKIRTRTVRSMLGLAHYRFRQKLEWMCRKHWRQWKHLQNSVRKLFNTVRSTAPCLFQFTVVAANHLSCNAGETLDHACSTPARRSPDVRSHRACASS